MAARRRSDKPAVRKTVSESPAKQLAGFLAKFDPPVARLVRSARSSLRKRFPTAIEQIYDNYNFLAIGFCATERASDCVVSLAISPKGVALSFYYGSSLPDPHGILLGSGNQNRYVRLVMKDGKTLSGKLLNLDTFAVQIFDSNEKLVNVSKTNVREMTMISPMPSYRDKLSTQEVADVVGT